MIRGQMNVQSDYCEPVLKLKLFFIGYLAETGSTKFTSTNNKLNSKVIDSINCTCMQLC